MANASTTPWSRTSRVVEPITVRFPHKEFFTYDPEFKVWMSTNYKPNKGQDWGIWRRLKLLPFEVYNRGRVMKKIFHPILDKLGIPHKGKRVGVHAFRHTLASMLLQMTGVKVAQRQLRHSDSAFTVEVYGHVLGDDHTEAMDNLESVLLDAKR
jgi:integrase